MKKKDQERDAVDHTFVKETAGKQNMPTASVTDTTNIMNSLTSNSCPSFLSAKPETKEDVNVPFPNTLELSEFLGF